MNTEPKWAKPLQWNEVKAGRFCEARGVLQYICHPMSTGLVDAAVIEVGQKQYDTFGEFATLDAAKAACQAHHEAQVRALMTDAAPELYEALAKCHAFFVSAGWEREPLSIEVSAALAKARGES